MTHASPAAQTHPPLVSWEDFIALDDDDRRELIDGELVEVEVPTNSHEAIVAMLIILLGSWAKQTQAGRVLASGYKIRIDQRRGVMPDVQFYRRDNPNQRQEQGLESGHPDLVIEVVSPSSVRYDRVKKLNWYASIEVPEYWIVTPEAQTLERLILNAGKYMVAEALEGPALFRPGSFDGLEIPLAELWDSGKNE